MKEKIIKQNKYEVIIGVETTTKVILWAKNKAEATEKAMEGIDGEVYWKSCKIIINK